MNIVDTSTSYQTINSISQLVPVSIVPPASSTFQTGNLPPPLIQNMVIPIFLLHRYAPLNPHQPMNAMPEDYKFVLPRLIGEDEITEEKHVATFCAFAKNMNVEYLDVVMRFVFPFFRWRGKKMVQNSPNKFN